jgi:predicted MFS family arabinose efflux permease
LSPPIGNKFKAQSFTAALGAFCAGSALGWTANLQNKILNFDYGFTVTEVDFSLIGSMLNFGAACVCLLMGFSINYIGRRGTLLLILIPFMLGWILLVTAADLSMLIIGRALIGIACGGCCVAAPVSLTLLFAPLPLSLFIFCFVSGLCRRDC